VPLKIIKILVLHSFESAPREAITIRARGAAPGEAIDNLTAKYQMAVISNNVGRCNIDREPYALIPKTGPQAFGIPEKDSL